MVGTAAGLMGPLVTSLVGEDPPVVLRFWDGSSLGDTGARTIVHVRSPDALKRLAFAPAELGLSRAYVAGDIDIDGDIFDVLNLRDRLGARNERVDLPTDLSMRLRTFRAAWRAGALGRPPAPPREEVRLRGPLHSQARDREAISHHYDVGNDFYRLVLGPSMTYSCAYYRSHDLGLEDAQSAKYDLICRKLGLKEGMRLLDVGCGWGGMLLHTAQHYGVEGVGITLSKEQATFAEKRIADAGFAGHLEVRLQDYRDVSDGPFDAISSIGMFEHVGLARLGDYFGTLYGLLAEGGRVLNHAISRPGGDPGFGKNSFVARYVFPDGELQEVGRVVSAMQEHGLEVRDVESLREHYARTLRSWVGNLEGNWSEAQAIVGRPRARIWRLYMAGSALGFEAGRINLHQVLGVKAERDGTSHMPLVRNWI
ncbi:MAG: methyltransferase domain-containing protein [Actinobacteria bacterium]|nr:methyltransferase domain-containing protein [Actinomycetota bacterium]